MFLDRIKELSEYVDDVSGDHYDVVDNVSSGLSSR